MSNMSDSPSFVAGPNQTSSQEKAKDRDAYILKSLEQVLGTVVLCKEILEYTQEWMDELDGFGYTKLMWAVVGSWSENNDSEVLKLLHAGSNPLVQNQFGRSALDLSIEMDDEFNRNTRIARILVAHIFQSKKLTLPDDLKVEDDRDFIYNLVFNCYHGELQLMLSDELRQNILVAADHAHSWLGGSVELLSLYPN